MTWHRHLGVYGILYKDEKLLVVNKTSGPYRNRYDLPGGGIEPQETIVQALHREFEEEVGINIQVIQLAGVGEYVVPSPVREHSHTQHIALIHEVSSTLESSISRIKRVSDDASGAEWVSLAELNEGNTSPLAMSAKQYLLNDPASFDSKILDDWVVKL
jgi:ADP-ribose pyrophosphatase YjhB (NUDIX family)